MEWFDIPRSRSEQGRRLGRLTMSRAKSPSRSTLSPNDVRAATNTLRMVRSVSAASREPTIARASDLDEAPHEDADADRHRKQAWDQPDAVVRAGIAGSRVLREQREETATHEDQKGEADAERAAPDAALVKRPAGCEDHERGKDRDRDGRPPLELPEQQASYREGGRQRDWHGQAAEERGHQARRWPPVMRPRSNLRSVPWMRRSMLSAWASQMRIGPTNAQPM